MSPRDSADWRGLLVAICVIYGVFLTIYGGYAYLHRPIHTNTPAAPAKELK